MVTRIDISQPATVELVGPDGDTFILELGLREGRLTATPQAEVSEAEVSEDGGGVGGPAHHPKVETKTHWWGYRVFLNHAAVVDLQSEETSDKVIALLRIALAAVPELQGPITTALEAFVVGEKLWIRSVDKGHGAILQASWLAPLVIVPKTWKR